VDGDGLRILATLLVGVATGVVSAMFGVGGGVVAKPAIRALGASPIETVGSTLPAVIPSAIAGTLRYSREGLVNWGVVARIGTVGAVFAVLGAVGAEVLPGDGRILMVAVSCVITYSAARIVFGGTGPDTDVGPVTEIVDVADVSDVAAESAPLGEGLATATVAVSAGQALAVGVAAGLINGLLGLGGGVVIVPALAGWLRLPIKVTVATSLACVGLISVPGTITHAVLGNINWLYALPLAVGVVPGARIGAHLAIAARERVLRLTVGGVLGVIAIVTGIVELVSLL